jgi:hypothetical protein
MSSTRAGSTIFGSVLNAMAISEGRQSGYYTYYGEYRSKRESTAMDTFQDVVTGRASLEYPTLEPDRAARHRRLRSGAR